MKYSEPNNADLFFNMARLFSKYCGRREEVIRKTMQMLEEAVSLAPENVEYQSEMAY